jgi:hypothetical protein
MDQEIYHHLFSKHLLSLLLLEADLLSKLPTEHWTEISTILSEHLTNHLMEPIQQTEHLIHIFLQFQLLP